MYKLHGLGVEFTCEICSNATYNGRKAFEKHFMESKHAFGLRALGLPPSKHFMYITKINDALARESGSFFWSHEDYNDTDCLIGSCGEAEARRSTGNHRNGQGGGV